MQLSLAINFSRLHAIAVEDAILRRDVEQARAVQQHFLPVSPPLIDGYELAGFYRAARHVGGDYIDYVPLENGRLAIVLGDVVGKGVPAALTMVQLATETRASLEVCETPSQVVTRLNRKLSNDFITLVVLVLDPATHMVTISNAGHESPLLRTSDGTVDAVGLDAAGFPLSVVEDHQYEELSIQLAPGDRLVIFSDGFPDAEHQASDRRFGTDEISRIFGEFDGAANEFIGHAVDQVDRFMDGGAQFDDMCMVCLRRTD
jgi:serine phosphatase RsbU (regulator of sigma subunit)